MHKSKSPQIFRKTSYFNLDEYKKSNFQRTISGRSMFNYDTYIQ